SDMRTRRGCRRGERRRRSPPCAAWRSRPPMKAFPSTSTARAPISAANTAAPPTPRSTPVPVSARRRVSGLVLAAGGSARLGRPKQLLPYGDATLLDHVLATARSCGFGQLLCVVGGAAAAVAATVDLEGVQLVENSGFAEGCSSSIAAALGVVDPAAGSLVLMLGDQPGVRAESVASLLAGRGDAPLAACAYDDGRRHPLVFARSLFGELAALHGGNGAWH